MSAPTGRGSSGRSFPTGWLASLCLVACLLVTGAVPPPARADDPAPLTVTLTSVAVSGSSKASTLTIAGQVTNASDAPAYGVKALLWRSTDRLRSLSSIEDVLATNRPSGRQVTDQSTEVAALTAPTLALAPRASASFSVSATLADLDLSADSSYYVGADATASATPGGDDTLAGGGRTLATVPGDTPPTVVSVVELASTPRRIRPNLFADDGLAGELSGRLKTLLDAAHSPHMTWVIDPSLYDEVADMADGYRVVADGGSVEGSGQAAAASWLAEFASLPRATGYETLYGRPDLVGAARGDSTSVIDRALKATRQSSLGLPILAASARVSDGSLTDAGARGLPVLTTGIGSAKAWVSMSGAKVSGALLPDARVDALPLGGDSPLTRSASLLAIARATGRQVRLIDTPGAVARDADATPVWLARTPLSALTATEAKPADTPLPLDAPGALTQASATRLDRLVGEVAAYGSAVRSSGLFSLADALVSNAASETWLFDPAGRTNYLTNLEQRSGAASLKKGVTLTAPPTVTLSSDTSQFPATVAVTTAIPEAIRVRVVGASDNSARVQVKPSDWVTIRPGDNLTVLMTATASGNGVVPVTLRVETQDELALGSPVQVSVEATNLGLVGWVIALVSGAVLVITTALRIRQVRRRRGA